MHILTRAQRGCAYNSANFFAHVYRARAHIGAPSARRRTPKHTPGTDEQREERRASALQSAVQHALAPAAPSAVCVQCELVGLIVECGTVSSLFLSSAASRANK